jgi:conjugal transfer mating pair stabilization protein TraG
MSSVIYTYAGGDALFEIFNGIAMFCGADSGIWFELASSLGVLIGSFYLAAKANPSYMIKWAAWYAAAVTILFIPKTTVLIEDVVTKDKHPVKGIPVLLAESASLISTLSYELARQFETVFSTPKELKYANAGTGFGSQIMRDADRVKIGNYNHRQNFNRFVSQCVFYDVMLHKYTMDDLMGTGDIWKLISKRPSPIRMFDYYDSKTRQTSLITCETGIEKLKDIWKDTVAKSSISWGKKYFHGTKTDAKIALLKGLNVSHQYFAKSSRDAGDIIKQKMMVNVLRDGFSYHAVKTNNTALTHKMAADRAYMQHENIGITMGYHSGEVLVFMKIVLECIIYALFAPVMIISIATPNGYKKILQFLEFVGSVSCFPVVYAVINMIMVKYGARETQGIIDSGIDSLSWGAAQTMDSIHRGIGAYAGYVSVLVPPLAWGLFKGGASSLVHMGSMLGGGYQGQAQNYGAQHGDGSPSFYNPSIGNQNYNNQGAFKYNTDLAYRAGGMSTRDHMGVEEHSYGGGNTHYNAPKTNIADTVNTSEGISSDLSNRAGESWSRAKSETSAYVDSKARAFDNMMSLTDNYSKNKASNTNFERKEGDTVQESMDWMENFKKEHNMLKNREEGKDMSVGGKVYASLTPGGPIGKLAGGLVGFNAGLEGNASGGISASKKDGFNKLQQAMQSEDFKKHSNNLLSASKTGYFNEGDSTQKTLADNMSASDKQAEEHRQSAESAYRTAQTADKAASLVQSNSNMLSQNHDQNIARMATRMLNSGELSQEEFDAYRNGTDPAVSKKVIGKYNDKLQDDVRQNAAIKDFATPEELKAKYSSDKQTINNMGGSGFRDRVVKKAESVGLGKNNRVVDDSVKTQVNKQIADGKDKISEGRERVSNQTSSIQNKVQTEQDKLLARGVLPDMPDSVSEALNMAKDGTHSGVSNYGGMPSIRGLREDNVASPKPTTKVIDSGSQSKLVDKNYIPSDDTSGGQNGAA